MSMTDTLLLAILFWIALGYFQLAKHLGAIKENGDKTAALLSEIRDLIKPRL